MTLSRALMFTWNGDTMTPLNPTAADRQFISGQRYRLVVEEERSDASHRAFFASVNEAFKNLPEALAAKIPSADHLRKFALIRAGFRDERTIVVASEDEAKALAAFMKPLDEFAVIAPNGNTVTVWTAKSQSLRAMGKKDFQASKDAVLDILAGLIGTTADNLQRNTDRAA